MMNKYTKEINSYTRTLYYSNSLLLRQGVTHSPLRETCSALKCYFMECFFFCESQIKVKILRSKYETLGHTFAKENVLFHTLAFSWEQSSAFKASSVWSLTTFFRDPHKWDTTSATEQVWAPPLSGCTWFITLQRQMWWFICALHKPTSYVVTQEPSQIRQST